MRLGEGRVDRGFVADMPVEAEIVGRGIEELGTSRFDRIIGSDHGRQFLVANVDQLSGILRLLARLRNDDRDGIADMAHLALRQQRPRRLDHG
jgi:hypothetical protein